ncbi:MAG: site-2 protease family protein [Patescibacteria group bacterium]|nr:site-2 protease family protein [Patescibacteria group bacterium]
MILQLLFSEPLFFFIWVAAIIVGITIHEFAHAWSAYLLGDPTAKNMGRLSLNPLVHLDPFGFLFLLIAGIGYGKPVPVNPYNLKDQKKGEILVSAAGPVSNLVQIVIFGLAFHFLVSLGPNNLLVSFLVALIYINIILMVFNLVPIPPLDGSKILMNVLPSSADNFKLWLQRRGPLVLFGLIILDRVLGLGIFAGIFNFFINLIFSVFG